MDLTNIDKNLEDGSNMGGTIQEIYVGFHDDVETWPTKPATPADIAANGVLTGDLIMKPGKNLFQIYVTDDTGELSFESVGETDGKSFVQHVSVFHPGLQASILGFLNVAKNKNLVIGVKDNNDKVFILGDENRPAVYVGSPDGNGTSKETAGRRGVSMEFTHKTNGIYQYTGTIPLTAASV
ncbi:MAG: hypothetical protein HQ541_19495 [Mariniphaga sp.]|nr:hypothetical protein [Mariniphaga sp.]